MRRALALVAFAVAACGGGDTTVAPPPPVPREAVPARLEVAGGLTVLPNADEEVADAFRVAGKKSLVRDGRVWELRKGDELVGALQLASLTERVDTTNDDDRRAVRRQILPGTQSELEVSTVPVWSARDGERGVYVWFGRQLLGVLQVKGGEFEPDDAATELITAIFASPTWPELAPEVFEEDGD